MPRPLTVAVLQARASDDPELNLARALEAIAAAAGRGAQLVATGELFRTRYFCQAEDHARFALAEPIPGPTTEALAAAARRLGIVIVASIFERRAAGVYHNTAVVLDEQGRLAGRYRKMHIPDDPRYYEKFYFTPGDLGFVSVPTASAAIGTLVCWDQWFPEAARLTALAGAELICIPTAIGWLPAEKAEFGVRQLAAWRTVQIAHAINNGVYVLAPNRVGLERDPGAAPDDAGIEFWGHSFIAAPDGTVVAEAGAEEETTLLATLDLEAVERTRQHWPFLRDRRLDAYAGITRRMHD
ncbi:MAG: carbon-nitrogen hydrolase [Terriglobales bacterium]